MADTPKTHRGVVLRTFSDNGTGETFEEGATISFDVGAFANYEHAGLVSAPSAAETKPETKAGTKTDA